MSVFHNICINVSQNIIEKVFQHTNGLEAAFDK